MIDVLGVKHRQSISLQIAKKSVRQRTQRCWVAVRRGVAGRAAITALAGEGHTEVVPAFVTAGAGKARPTESANL